MKQMRGILLFSVLTFALLITGKADASCNGNNPPTITTISPSIGSVSGGTVVTISGRSLGCVSVTFGGVSAISVTATGTTVTATSPAGAVGTVNLIVTNPNVGANANASATTQFSYITTASAPTSLVATAGDGQVSVAFTAPSSDGGATITDYEYQLDGGSWVSASTTSSPVVITGLTNGTTYSIKLRAVNAAGSSAVSAAATSTPITVATVPTSLVATAGDGQVSVAFTAPSSNGGAAITDYEYQLDGGSWVSASTTSSPVVITGLMNGTTYSIKLRAVNAAGSSAESLSVSVSTPSPALEFAVNETLIRDVVVRAANRSLSSSISTNRLTVVDARERFILSQSNSELVTRSNIPFDVDGVFSLSGATLSTNGTFFGQSGSADGTWRRLFFGDFNVQRDGNTGSNTATLSARVAWEQIVSDTTMLGYFIGAEFGDSDIRGSFTGDQTRVVLTLGGYAVHELAEQVYLEGFLTFGAGRNDLSMSNDVLALDSDYNTSTATLGAAVSGIYEYEAYEFHPELSFSYGHTWIGNVGFTGRAYGLVDNTLSLDAGNVFVANLIFRPEVIWGLDAGTVAESNSQLSFAPRMICEQTRSTRRTEACGGGAELGLRTQSDDGLTNAEFRVLMDRVGSSERTSYAINLEHRF